MYTFQKMNLKFLLYMYKMALTETQKRCIKAYRQSEKGREIARAIARKSSIPHNALRGEFRRLRNMFEAFQDGSSSADERPRKKTAILNHTTRTTTSVLM